ncbi:hypothetical protein BJ165DRAFT_742998 [Panaeolus papilionaceus]|nr:hypothetical protein BJ165DRAFT_742998 [Panaeolus papilionaceus]
MEILTLISNWLKLRYEKGVLLSGLIYLHRITDNRMSGSPARNLRMFGKLCGDAAASRVAFITTMWDRASGDASKKAMYEKRQVQLEKYWEPMTSFGARIGTFANTTDSAWDAISILLKVSRLPFDHPNATLTHADIPLPLSYALKPGADDAHSMMSHKSTATYVSWKMKRVLTSFSQPFDWIPFIKCSVDDSSTVPFGTEDESIPAPTVVPHVAVPCNKVQPKERPSVHISRLTTVDETPSSASRFYHKNSLPFPTSNSEPTSPSLGSPGELWVDIDRLLTTGTRLSQFLSPSPTPTATTIHLPKHFPHRAHIAPTDDNLVTNTRAEFKEPTSPTSSASVYSTQTHVEDDSSSTTITPEIIQDTLQDDDAGFIFIDAPKTVLHLQAELVHEHKKVHETDAAQTLYSTLQALIHENRRNLKNLLDEKSSKMDQQEKTKLEKDIQILEGQFQQTFKEMKRLEMPPLRRAFLKVYPSSLWPKTRALDMGSS